MNETKFAKLLVLLNGAVPLALLGWDASHHQLGANAVNGAILTTGMLALVFLCLSLTITPLRWLTGWRWLPGTRRLFGLYAFFYALIHFGIFFLYDRSGSVSSTLEEMLKRKYLIVGSTALLVMLPLALTSTSGMIRRLGAVRWKALHRLAYVAGIAAVIHYYMQVKADTRRPTIFFAVMGTLLSYRLVRFVMGEATKPVGATEADHMSSPPAHVPIKRPWTGELQVQSVNDAAPGVKTFRLKSPDSADLPFEHLPGQYLTLRLNIDGIPVARSYTIASSPTSRQWCELTIKREESGIASRHMHDNVRSGDRLHITAPAGRFTFVGDEARAIALIGGGVGITPLMSVVRYLTARRWPGRIDLLYSCRTESEIIFRDEMRALSESVRNLNVTLTVTRGPAASSEIRQGRITAELIQECVPNFRQTRFHVCGPTAMMNDTSKLLRDLGVSEENIAFESFETNKQPLRVGTPPVAPVEEPLQSASAPPSVRFASSGREAVIKGAQTILEAGEEIGVKIEFDCRSGVCGTCKTRLLSGRVKMEIRDALDAAEEAQGFILACQAIPVDAVVVEA